jgi:hypothetical protein
VKGEVIRVRSHGSVDSRDSAARHVLIPAYTLRRAQTALISGEKIQPEDRIKDRNGVRASRHAASSLIYEDGETG